MEICRLVDRSGVADCVKKSVAILRTGGVIIYPTDTLYGLGADALSDEAVAKVYAIKGREERKPIHCIVADLAMAEKYAEVDDLARELGKAFFPGPLTLILKKRKGIETGIAKGLKTIGIRIPKNPFCLALAREFGKPFTTTSANRSGYEPERSIGKILTQLRAEAALVDLVIEAGELPARAPSTVVDLTGTRPLILREGAIPASEIWDTLNSSL